MGQRSREELLRFLDYIRAKGLMSPATAESRKAAANKVLGILDEEEADDVTTLDLDEVVHRFQNLHGQKYTPDSLRTYKSRTKSAVEDFARYLENPLAYKPGVLRREKIGAEAPAQKKTHNLFPNDLVIGPPQLDRPTLTPSAGSTILPIPVRADLIVHIQGLPFDLTPAEAKKIASVVQAMAMTE